MSIPATPVSRIMAEMFRIADEADVGTLLGLGSSIAVRHYRHRPTNASERPCLALRVADDALNDEFENTTMDEVPRLLEVDLVLDMELVPEQDGEDALSDSVDPTGWDHLYGIALTYAKLFLAYDSELRDLVDDVLPGDHDPDQDSKPDDGRLVISVRVLYRTRFDDPLELL